MPRSFPIFFYPEDRTLLISGGFGSNLEWLARIFVIFRKSGSKFQSVNTKTTQFSPFFDLHEFEKNMSTPKVWEKNMSTTPKTNQFSPFFGLPGVWEKHVNTKTNNFPIFLDSRSLRKNMSTPTLGNFPHFLDSRSWEIICMSVQTLLKEDIVFRGNCTFPLSYPLFWYMRMVLSFSLSTPKLVNFPHFLTCTSLRKTCQHQKFEKKNMSTPKTNQFSPFLDSRSLRKTCQHQN